jgi:hypothetical protein
MIGRILAVVAAIVVCAWFALGVVQAHDTDAATTVIGASVHLTHAQALQADSLLSSAGTLNPDTTVTLLRGEAALKSGHPRRALAIELPVTRAEPLNVDAWAAVATAAYDAHRGHLLTRAAARIGVLDPAPSHTR